MKLRANIIANYAGQGWTALMGLVFAPVYISLLGIEAYGLIGFFTVLQVWFALLDLGMLPTSIREMARFTSGFATIRQTRNLLRSFEIIALALGATVALAIWLASGTLATGWLNANALAAEEVAGGIALMGVILATRLGEGLYKSCLIGLQRQVWLNVASMVLATVRSVGAAALLYWIEPSIILFFTWQALVSFVSLMIFGLSVHRSIPGSLLSGRFSTVAMKAIGGFAVSVLGINLLSVLLTQTDKILLSNLLPLNQYGYYMLASAVTGVMYMFTGPVTQAIFPVFVAQADSGDKSAIARTFHNAAELVTAILAPLGLFLILFAEPLMFFWTGDANLAAIVAPLVSLLAIGTLANTFMQVPYYAQVAHGWTSMALKVNMVAVLVLAPSLFLMVPRWGPVAAAVVWAVLNFSYLLIAPLIFRRILRGEMWRWYIFDLAKPFAAALVVLLLLRLPLIGASPDRWLQGAYIVLAGGAGLGASLLTVGRLRAYLMQVPPVLARKLGRR